MRLLKFKNWEHWPSYLFYLPNIPYAAYYTLKAGNLVFFSATNPAIKHSGNGSESKFTTTELIPTAYKPISIFIDADQSIKKTIKSVEQNTIKFPLIIKPNIGFRGLLVEKINTETELINYLTQYKKIDLIIQEFISYKNECGIFYHKIPNETKGKITSITLKKYPTVTGDGTSTLEELISKNKRAQLYTAILEKLHSKNYSLVIPKGEEFILNTIGNHSKGTQFINGNHLITTKLESAVDTIFQQIPDIYYGRFDLKYNSIEELLQLKHFKIIEINGIISEPTHIYDPNNITYFKALKEIRKHWKLIYKIATTNHKINHVKYDKIGDFLNSLKQLKKYTDQIKAESLLDKN